MQYALKAIMLGMLLVMLLAIFIPAFFTKNRKSAKTTRNVIIVDSASKEQQERLLAYAETLVKDHSVANGEIVLIALGSGINLFDASNIQRQRVEKLIHKGVQAYICDKTYRAKSQRFELIPQIMHVENGIALADELMNAGYVNQFA